MDTRTSGDDLWTTASADAGREIEESLFTAVRVEASQFWPVLAAATSKQDFETRLEVLAPQLDAATASVLDDETDSYYPTLRNRIEAAFENDFGIMTERRTEAAQRHQAALRQQVVEEIFSTAGAADGTEDPGFLAAPAEGQSGPASTGGTPGSEGEDNASGIQEDHDESKGPNVIPSEDVANEVTGSFKTYSGLTRKDFEAIAAIIKSQPETVRQDLANQFASYCAGTNPQFDRGRFLRAATGSRLDFSRVAYDYAGAGWTPEGPGFSKDHVWVGEYTDDPNPELGSWLVHYKDDGAIETASFPTEADALAFAQTKTGVTVPVPSTQQAGQTTYYTAAVDTSSIPPEWIQHAADRATYSGTDTEWGLANRANPNSWVTEWQLLAPEQVRPGEYLVDEKGNVRQASHTAGRPGSINPDYNENLFPDDRTEDVYGSGHPFYEPDDEWYQEQNRRGRNQEMGTDYPMDVEGVRRTANEDDDEQDKEVANGDIGSGDVDYVTQFRKKDHQGPGPKFIAYDQHNEGLHNPELDNRTQCAMCHNKAFDGQRCHACGWNGHTAARHIAADPGWIENDPDWWENKNKGGYGMPNTHPFWKNQDFEDIGQWRVFDRDGKTYAYNRQQNSWYRPGDRATIMDWVNGFNANPIDIHASRKQAVDDWAQIMSTMPGGYDPVRRAASDYISADRGPDSLDGISSSDVNHTIYDTAKQYQRADGSVDWDAVVDYFKTFVSDRGYFSSRKLASEDLTDEQLRDMAAQGNELAASMLKIREDRNHTTALSGNPSDWTEEEIEADHKAHGDHKHPDGWHPNPHTRPEWAHDQGLQREFKRDADGKFASIDGETWDTGEVALWFDNDFGLYQQMKNAHSPADLERIWNENKEHLGADVDLSQVNWDAVYADVKDED